MFLNYFYLSSSVTLVQQEVRPDQRVMSGALLLLIMNLIGLGLGPTYVGAASDFFRAYYPDHSLQIALVYAGAVLLPCHRALPLAGSRAARESRKLERQSPMISLRRLAACIAAASLLCSTSAVRRTADPS